MTDASAELARYTSRKGRRLAEDLIRDGGLADVVASFSAALGEIRKRPEAAVVVDGFGRILWQHAVGFTAGEGRGRELPGDDDRPLYWARLAMLWELHEWRPRFRRDDAESAALARRLEWASRGITSTTFGADDEDVVKVLVSGFDPFRLTHDPAASNPSGAVALRLHGRTVRHAGRDVRFATVVLPVRYADFDGGVVEKVFGPHLRPGPHLVDLAATVSQGRPGRFDLELFNGRRRHSGTTRDNSGVVGGADATAPVAPDSMPPGPEFTASTLPVDAMAEAETGGFPVHRNATVCQLSEDGRPVERPGGPEGDGLSVSGGGGGFLSNEVAYRVTRLRDELGAAVPCGHVHTPSLAGTGDDTPRLRTEIVTQTTALLLAAVAASPAGDPVTL
ncbi:pyrrolidone-carboxylate peptidase [Stackebrandtia albiflava]|uniref:Pyrrolidone-carboxylate peptidase n=1 Tax=Stackebrandtia albiflava TaxID=406432 RepID=A0A562VDU8_9ACTN|nr:pyroglutamyl peptidase [Stackebrandtia albiflava]TWJ15987.1 pyrrolidone-carboxylate peptidase [Stackebrandtia albiflava]